MIDCCIDCHCSIRCYLLDEHAYVVWTSEMVDVQSSESLSYSAMALRPRRPTLGAFFGDLKPPEKRAMQRMVEQNVYEK